MKTVSETAALLMKARDLISDESRWCQGNLGVDAYGHPTEDLEFAVRVCSVGALLKVYDDDLPRVRASTALNAASRELSGNKYGIVDFNDNTGHAAVMEMFDRAIEAEMEDEG